MVVPSHSGTQRSRLTFLIYLNDDFEGGCTTYFIPSQTEGVMNVQSVVPRTGCLVCFPHGDAKGSLLHEGSSVVKGTKYILRTDVLYELPESEWRRDTEEVN
jgi:2OG-Fe(II) oxygenase superfamily